MSLIAASFSGDCSYHPNDDHHRHFEGGTTEKSPPKLTLTLFEVPLIFGTAKISTNEVLYFRNKSTSLRFRFFEKNKLNEMTEYCHVKEYFTNLLPLTSVNGPRTFTILALPHFYYYISEDFQKSILPKIGLVVEFSKTAA